MCYLLAPMCLKVKFIRNFLLLLEIMCCSHCSFENYEVNTKFLDLSNRKLVSLDKNIARLKDLEVLVLSNNQLEALPNEIGELKNLKKLDLSNNHLNFLPEEIGNLTNLLILLVYENKLKSLPRTIGKLKKLEEFQCLKMN